MKSYEALRQVLNSVCEWWHEYVMKAKEIRFLRGRLKFGDSKSSAPFPSAIVVF